MKTKTDNNMETKQETVCGITVTDIKIFPFKDVGLGHIRALANVVLNEAIMLRGLRIMEDNKSLFLSYPSDPFFTGIGYSSIIVPVTRELREYIENKVIKQYQKVVNE